MYKPNADTSTLGGVMVSGREEEVLRLREEKEEEQEEEEIREPLCHTRRTCNVAVPS